MRCRLITCGIDYLCFFFMWAASPLAFWRARDHKGSSRLPRARALGSALLQLADFHFDARKLNYMALTSVSSHRTFVTNGLASSLPNCRVRSSCQWPAVPPWKDRHGESCEPWECWSIFAASKFIEEARPLTSRYCALLSCLQRENYGFTHHHTIYYTTVRCGGFW